MYVLLRFLYCHHFYWELVVYVIMASIPSQRYNKSNWLILHNNHCLLAKNSNATTLLIRDSIIAGFNSYPSEWNKYFGNNSVNFGIRGDRVQNVLWISINLPILSSLSKIVILCGNQQYL